MPPEGPTFAWANRFRRQMNHSLREVAASARVDPRLAGIRAVHTRLASASPGHRDTVRRFSAHFGFETIVGDAPAPMARRFQSFVDNLWAWVMVWTFNPPALKGRDVMKRREDIWISVAALTARFAPKDLRDAVDAPGPAADDTASLAEASASSGLAEGCGHA